MIAKTGEEIKNLRTAGRLLGEILRELAKDVKPGITTASLDLKASQMIEAKGAKPAFLGYKPDDAAYPYPAALCVSIDDEVVHGIPTEDRVIKQGQLVMLDLGLSYNGYFADAAVTVCAGKCDEKGEKLIEATKEALNAAVKVIKPGAYIGDIGAAIMAVAKKYNLAVVEDLGGHSLGKVPHERPFIANVGRVGEGEILEEGLVIAVEPIFTEGKADIELMDDEWTYKTVDGSRSAETEHTILVTKNGAEILTA
ncbi:type I methionyl aminopeptidase [Candidatus Parcubacteria bacterium]|nr:type I methionyl aminopeptidase [Candidatus Parcubacteria bacterium]